MSRAAPEDEIVLVGAGGFIGRHVLAELIKRPRRIHALTTRPLPLPLAADASVSVVNLHDREYYRRFPVASSFIFIHCAWCPPVRHVWAAHAEQVALIGRALDWGGERIARVIGIGSAEEYGAAEGCLLECQAAASKLSPYAWGKRAAQSLVSAWSEQTGKDAAWLRPFTVYGEGQEGSMVIPYAIRQARAGLQAKFSDCRQKRDFVHVADVARGIVAAAESRMDGYRELNLGSGSATPVRELLARIARHYRAEALFEFGALPRRKGEPDEQFADIRAANKILGWKPSIDIDEGLGRMFGERNDPNDA